jgi:hypothetical protein
MMTGAEGCRHIRGDAIESRRILCVRIDEIELHWTRLSAGPSSGEKDDKNDCDDDRQGSQSASNAGTNFLTTSRTSNQLITHISSTRFGLTSGYQME